VRGLNKKPTTVVSRGFLLKLSLASTRASGIADDNDDVQNDSLQSIFQHNVSNLAEFPAGSSPLFPAERMDATGHRHRHSHSPSGRKRVARQFIGGFRTNITWVLAGTKEPSPPKHSAVPDGTFHPGHCQPSVETPDYGQSSCGLIRFIAAGTPVETGLETM
jgi:hypothetical protein